MSAYTPDEFAYKVDSEGGIYDALFGYGLTADDVDGSTSEGAELKRLVAAVIEQHAAGFGAAMDALGSFLDDLDES